MRMWLRGIEVGLLAGALLALGAAPAAAVSLQAILDEINLNGSYTDTIGGVTFDFTAINETNAVLTDIDLQLVSAGNEVGFDLVFASGALVATDFGAGDIGLEFTVSSGQEIVGGSNLLAATVSGLASVSASDNIVEIPAHDLGVSDGSPFASGDFTDDPGNPFTFLTIDAKNVVVFSNAAGASAEANSLAQRFTLVPEPSTSSLLVLGLLAVALRRRASRS